MSEKIKVVFRQKTYEEKFCTCYTYHNFINPKEIRSECGNLISDDEITTTQCDKGFISLLRERHIVHLKESDKQEYVSDIIPQSDGSYICYLQNKKIVTETTKDSLLEEYYKLQDEKEKEIRELKERLYNNKHRLFNFGRASKWQDIL